MGQFEYLVMLFGFINAPAVFPVLVNNALSDFIDDFVFVYLDYILIYSQSNKQHTQHIWPVLQKLYENQLSVKSEKCKFHVSFVSFLGFIFEGGQYWTNLEKAKAVVEWLVPKNWKQLLHFLGLINFYRQFIKDYSWITTPLTQLTYTLRNFRWTPEANTAFSKLKQLFSSTPILCHPDPTRQFIKEKNASDTGVGAI